MNMKCYCDIFESGKIPDRCWRVLEIEFLAVIEKVVLLLSLGMVNGDDYAGDLLLIYSYSAGERLCLRLTLRENNSVGG